MKPTKSIRLKRFCFHCGGPLKQDVDLFTCIMCGREAQHRCPNCLFGMSKKEGLKQRTRIRKVA